MRKLYKKTLYLLVPIVLFLLLFLLPSKRKYDLPVNYQFVSSTNSITFVVLDEYELYNISCDRGFFDTSKIRPCLKNR